MKRLLLAALFFFSIIINVKASDTLDIKKWKPYYIKDENLKFSYPDFILHLDSTNNQLSLSHFIKYKHPNPCIFEGNEIDSLDFIVDLGFSMRFFNSNIKSVLKNEVSDSIFRLCFAGDTLIKDNGFIDKIKANNLKGYGIQQGVEGCGYYILIFPVKDKLTLEITMRFAGDINMGMNNQNEGFYYPSVKGLMSHQLSEKVFYKILETIR